MKRLLIALSICSLCIAAPAWGATYYVNSLNGDNTNNGTNSSTPWKSLAFADDMTSAGDTVSVIATKLNPLRDNFYPNDSGTSGNEITFTGSVMAYILGTIDVSDGVTSANFVDNGSFDAWESASQPWDMVATPNGSALAREATIISSGKTYSLKMDKAGSTPSVEFDVYLPAATSIDISYQYYHTSNGKKIKFDLWDRTANERYDFINDIWSVGGDPLEATDNINTWNTASETLTTQSAGKYTVTLKAPTAGTPSTYVGDVSIVLTNDYTWAVHSGTTYKLEDAIPAAGHLLKSATWTTDGAAGLAYVTKASSLANCISTANTWWYESDVLYYHLASGEAISTVHLEFSRITSRASTAQSNIVDITTDFIDFSNFDIRGSYGSGIQLTGSDTLGFDNFNLHHNFAFNWSIGTDTTATINNSFASWSFTEDNIAVGGTAVVTLNNFRSAYSWDEGVEAFSDGTITCNNCLVYRSGQNESESTENFSATNTGDLILNNCTNYGAPGGGIAIGEAAEDTSTGVIKNNISWGNLVDMKAGAGVSSITATNNIFNTTDAEWDVLVNDATNLNSDPLFVNAASNDFELQKDSPAIDTGTDVGLTTDFNGNKIPRGNAPDIGAYEYQTLPETFATKLINWSGVGSWWHW